MGRLVMIRACGIRRILWQKRGRACPGGFSLIEVIVAVFVFLIGVMGVLFTFTAGMRARLVAQELVISQDLAQKWYEWVRFRMNEHAGPGAPTGALARTDLSVGKTGSFYENSGDLYHSPADGPNNPPTYNQTAYRGYRWIITAADHGYKPMWEDKDGATHPWDQSKSGNSVVPSGVGAPPSPISLVELTIERGTRRYRFQFVFSGVGRKYDAP